MDVPTSKEQTMRRQLRPREETPINVTPAAIESEQVAAYLRQSTTGQVLRNPESTDMQLSGAQRYAISQGLDADKIVIAHEGNGQRGVSGTLRIDQREELRDVVVGIEAGIIKLVWAYSVSRLFRDKYGVQVATFIQICAEHSVQVVIETAKQFDFANSFDVFLFQFLANVAARENEDRSKLLHTANKQKALRGEYHGRPLVPGFIVDRNKQSPTFGRFIEYAPHSQVTRRLYERYRELGGQFNLLAREVAAMPFVYPEFDEEVDTRDRKKFRLKRVPGGYHLTPITLFRLLTAVEVAGYWKFDGAVLVDASGQPKENHAAIVPRDLWEYAFRSLSFTGLDGDTNTDRVRTRKTWAPGSYKGRGVDLEKKPALYSILSSPLGTVQYTSGKFRVTEQRPGIPGRSNTLTVKAQELENIFMRRLMERTSEATREQLLIDAVTEAHTRNTRALVSVDQQIAKYRAEIKGIQAYIIATGATADKETLQQFNEQLLDARANLHKLETAKSDAAIEERSLQELIDAIACICYDAVWCIDKAQTRRYIRLATDRVSIDEYSANVLRLTVVWSAPFSQTDVCYILRANPSQQEWTEQDNTDLAALWPLADRRDILARFPMRTWSCISTWAWTQGLTRDTRANTSDVPGRFLSLADVQLQKATGWDMTPEDPEDPEDSLIHWLYDVTTDGNDFGATCRLSTQATIVRWLSELRTILAA